MGAKSDTPDLRVAKIAARQHGVVTRRQLEEAGLGSRAITIRARKGQLHRIHRGVYVLGAFSVSHRQRWMAAVLACGEGAVLSHHSAAALWELLRPIDGPVHVSVPITAGRISRRGIHLHRCPSLAELSSPPSSSAIRGERGGQLVAYRHRIPVTTIQRTIDDLDGTMAPYLLRRAKRQAELKNIRLGDTEGHCLRSDLEEGFLSLCAQHRLPPSENNTKIGRWEVDFVWRDQKLVVEIDSFAYHRGSIAFQNDRARDLDLRQRGFTVLRFSEKQLEEEPSRVAADVARALGEKPRSKALSRPTT